MIWREDDKREELQKKLEYARELDQQIELRRQLEAEERQQAEEWERHFVAVSSDQSPAKWWSQVGDPASNRFGFTMDASALPQANGSIETSASSATRSGSFQRFRNAVDPLSTQDRFREKAQQLEWRRLLDEQVREKERRQQQEAEAQRRSEYKEAQEEMHLLREHQLRAQRKLGIADSGGVTSTNADLLPSNYVAIPSPPAPQKQARDYEPSAWSSVQPPPAPTQLRVHGGSAIDYNFREAMGLSDQPQQQSLQDSRYQVANEYRALLAEIRREREELRSERDELRREKEELRMERALMQMENEKMATLLESQRQMNEQRLESMARFDRALDQAESDAALHNAIPARSPGPTKLPSPLQPIDRGQALQPYTPRRAQESPVHRIGSRLGALSMADFAIPCSALRSPVNAISSPRIRRLARFRQREENPLERSLVGESEFVALDHEESHMVENAGPRIMETMSPAASRFETRPNPLRSSRVIKSRGFYDFNRPGAVLPQATTTRTMEDHHSPVGSPQNAARHAARPTTWMKQEQYHERYYDQEAPSDDDGEDEDEDYGDEDEDEGEHESEPELSRSLFQVQVLVNE